MTHPLILPPGFEAFEILGRAFGGGAFGQAVAAAAQDGDAGTVFHAPLAGRCEAAIVLALERPINEVPVLRIGALALHDALSALAPIGIPIRITAPDRLDVNGAQAASLRMLHSAAASTAAPAWAVLGFDVSIDLSDANPGDTPHLTSLVEEGFDGPELAASVLVGTCRHLLAWVDAWSDQGERAISGAWIQASRMVMAPAQ
jgi:hypothetical protein